MEEKDKLSREELEKMTKWLKKIEFDSDEIFDYFISGMIEDLQKNKDAKSWEKQEMVELSRHLGGSPKVSTHSAALIMHYRGDEVLGKGHVDYWNAKALEFFLVSGSALYNAYIKFVDPKDPRKDATARQKAFSGKNGRQYYDELKQYFNADARILKEIKADAEIGGLEI